MVFLQTIDCAQYIYLTVVDAEFEGDTFFGELNSREWKLISEKKFLPDEKNLYTYYFQLWENSRARS